MERDNPVLQPNEYGIYVYMCLVENIGSEIENIMLLS